MVNTLHILFCQSPTQNSIGSSVRVCNLLDCSVNLLGICDSLPLVAVCQFKLGTNSRSCSKFVESIKFVFGLSSSLFEQLIRNFSPSQIQINCFTSELSVFREFISNLITGFFDDLQFDITNQNDTVFIIQYANTNQRTFSYRGDTLLIQCLTLFVYDRRSDNTACNVLLYILAVRSHISTGLVLNQSEVIFQTEFCFCAVRPNFVCTFVLCFGSPVIMGSQHLL